MIPDGASRKLLLEQGYQSKDIGQFRFSDSVRSPGDSSFIEILNAGVTEFRTPDRIRFAPNSVYDVFTLAAVGQPSVFDSVLITNANAALTTIPVAQVRVINIIADTTRAFDVRLGCPNGTPLVTAPVRFGQASLYSEVYPSRAVFSVSSIVDGITSVVGTFETVLGERKAYSLIIYRDALSSDALFLFIEAGDLTSNAQRQFIPVINRTADLRVINLSTASVDVQSTTAGQTLASALPPHQMGAVTTLATCEGDRADVFTADYSDGRTATDSTSLSVRGKFSVITIDSAGSGRIIIAPTIRRPLGSAGKAVMRVINASATSGSIVLSVGARSATSAPNGIASGYALTNNVVFGNMSAPAIIASGLLPLTVTTSITPTRLLDVTRTSIENDKNYDLIVYDVDGQVQTLLVEEEQSSIPLTPLPDAVFFRFINGSRRQSSVPIEIGLVLPSGTVFASNSIATTLPVGSIPFNVNGVTGLILMVNNQRMMTVYSDGGGSPNLVQISTDPMIPVSGLTSRRMVNATEDVRLVSICVDSIPTVSGQGDHLGANIAYGTTSDVHTSDSDRRGTYYVYNSETRERLFALPVQFAPMGNNYTLVVIGRKEHGYEVIVSQEF